jgi:hypothetical protein
VNLRDASLCLFAKDAVITNGRFSRKVNRHTDGIARTSEVVNSAVVGMTEAPVPGLKIRKALRQVGMFS